MAWSDAARAAARAARAHRIYSPGYGAGLKHTTRKLLAFHNAVTATLSPEKRKMMAMTGRDLHRLAWGKKQVHNSIKRVLPSGRQQVVTPKRNVVMLKTREWRNR